MSDVGRKVAWIYFLIHMLVELICFALLYDKLGYGLSLIVVVTYDFFAFVPQGVIGELKNRCRKLDIGTIGAVLLGVSILLLGSSSLTRTVVGMVILGLGNAFLHEAGAIATVTVGEGKLFPSALFVAGGSFGLILGQTLGKMGMNRYLLILAVVLIEALVLVTNKYWMRKGVSYPIYQLVRTEKNEWLIIGIAVLVTAIRSFVGYAIPISWNKTAWQAFALFFVMGAGKGIGGWLADRYGARKVGVISTLACIPFLLLGKDMMLISILGVFLFSMTMSITFGMLMSVIPDDPGLAFGMTTIGLFVGVCPVLIWGSFGDIINSILVVVLSVLCAGGLRITLKEG